jgi:hypothetical protein
MLGNFTERNIFPLRSIQRCNAEEITVSVL